MTPIDNTMIASVDDLLYHASSVFIVLGVSEYTRPLRSSSLFFRFVKRDKMTVRMALVENAKMAVQKFCAISTGYACKWYIHPPLTRVAAPSGNVSP